MISKVTPAENFPLPLFEKERLDLQLLEEEILPFERGINGDLKGSPTVSAVEVLKRSSEED